MFSIHINIHIIIQCSYSTQCSYSIQYVYYIQEQVNPNAFGRLPLEYNTTLYYTILSMLLYNYTNTNTTLLYYTILYYTILYYTILYNCYTILYYLDNTVLP